MEESLISLLNLAIDRTIIGAKDPLKRKKGEICYYCGISFNSTDWGQKKTYDHIMPKARGGVDLPFNLAIVCNRCNRDKGSKHPIYYLMEGSLNLENQLLLDWLARILYHSLTTLPDPEPVF